MVGITNIGIISKANCVIFTGGAVFDFLCPYTYDADGNLVYMNLNGSLYYYERNAQNDISALIDTNMNEVVTYSYDTWGKLLNIGGSLASTAGTINPFRYRGYYYDTETGLYYLQSRYYDANTGRFLNAD